MTREHIDMHLEYGQVYYAKSRHFLRKPNCTPPENLTEHAAANGWDFEHFFRQFERAGVIPPPEK